MEALMDVRTACGFADRVKIPGAQLRFQRVNGLEVRSPFPKPLWQSRTCARSRLDLDKRTQVRETLLYRLPVQCLVVAAEETADIAACKCTQWVALAAIVAVFFRR